MLSLLLLSQEAAYAEVQKGERVGALCAVQRCVHAEDSEMRAHAHPERETDVAMHAHTCTCTHTRTKEADADSDAEEELAAYRATT